MSYKSINGLMRHLRESGIYISGSRQKTLLRNTGYFHGYKGYRFFKSSDYRIPFKTYEEVDATIRYDSQIKSIIYSRMMYIETAVKSIALESILDATRSEKIQDMLDIAVSSYKNAPANSSPTQRKQLQQQKLNLQKSIQTGLANAYKKGNPKITHFYDTANSSDVPLWALFEILTMGDFGRILQCLTYNVRDDISKRLGLNVSFDSNRELIYKYIYTLKDLRNAVAHNAVVFDTRFRNIDPSRAMRECLRQEVGLPYVNFKTIGDYVILMSYYLKLLNMPKKDIRSFIREFEKATEEYRRSVSKDVSSIVIHPDLPMRLEILKRYI